MAMFFRRIASLTDVWLGTHAEVARDAVDAGAAVEAGRPHTLVHVPTCPALPSQGSSLSAPEGERKPHGILNSSCASILAQERLKSPLWNADPCPGRLGLLRAASSRKFPVWTWDEHTAAIFFQEFPDVILWPKEPCYTVVIFVVSRDYRGILASIKFRKLCTWNFP